MNLTLPPSHANRDADSRKVSWAPAVLGLVVLLFIAAGVVGVSLSRLRPNLEDTRGMNGLILDDPIVLAEFEWTGPGAPPDDSACRRATREAGRALRPALPSDWEFREPVDPAVPGRLTLFHSPSQLRWEVVILLEPERMNEPGRIRWVVRYVRPGGAASDAHTLSNWRWTWRDAVEQYRLALQAAEGPLTESGWTVVGP